MSNDLPLENELFTIRNATSHDADAIQALMCQLGYPLADNISRQQTRACLSETNGVLLVAEYERAILGVLYGLLASSLERKGNFGLIWALVVDEAWRGKGVGEQLCRAAEQEFSRRGAEVVYVTSGFKRTGAHVFYQRIGYGETGLRFARELSPETSL